MPLARRCTATCVNGQRCRSWAQPESEPPLCSVHAGWRPSQPPLPFQQPEPNRLGDQADPGQSLYSRTFSGEEVAALFVTVVDHSLNGEVMAARVAVRRVLEQLEKELSPAEYARLAALIFTGTNTIAGLLRAQRTLSGETADELVKLLNRALDEMVEDEGMPL